MTITKEHLEKAAKAAGYEGCHWFSDGLGNPEVLMDECGEELDFLTDHGQLHDLAMACKIDICPSENRIYFSTEKFDRYTKVNCRDFPALAEAVILAACEQFDAKD